MNQEPIIQSEVSQKEKDKYCILTYTYRIQKNDTEEFIYRSSNGETDLDLLTWGGGGESETYDKSNMGTYITICKIDSQWGFNDSVN